MTRRVPLRFEHDVPGTPYEASLPGLRPAAVVQIRGPPIYLDLEKAELLLGQFQETANHRGWIPRASAIMTNHWHMVVQVPDDPDPTKILADFKAYGTRVLSRKYGGPRKAPNAN